MKYHKIQMLLKQEIPALQSDQEGKLKGGFTPLNVADISSSTETNVRSCGKVFICNNNCSCKKKKKKGKGRLYPGSI